jgi:hypothetical protein
MHVQCKPARLEELRALYRNGCVPLGTPPQEASCRAPGARLRAPASYGPQEASPSARFTAAGDQAPQLQYIPTTAPDAALALAALAIVEAARLKQSTAQRAPAHTGNGHYLHSYRRHPLGAMTGPSYPTGGEGPVWAILLRSRPTGPSSHHTPRLYSFHETIHQIMS